MESEEKHNENFRVEMDRLLKEARERYERMSPEDQQLLDEAARRHHEKVRSEIMASYEAGIQEGRIESIKKLPINKNS